MNRNKLLDTSVQELQPKQETAKTSIVPFARSDFKKRENPNGHYSTFTVKERKKQVAFHQAGHAAAMYLNNKDRALPPVFFQIKFKDIKEENNEYAIIHRTMYGDRIANIEGGRLIQSLPITLEGLTYKKADSAGTIVQLVPDYMNALEADIINLLAGPLAEARHVHDCDNEILTRNLVDIGALVYYDVDCDLALIREYLQNSLLSPSQQDEKLHELLTLAFNFVKNNSHWDAITRLAKYILQNNNTIISYEEIVSVLESASLSPERQPVINFSRSLKAVS